MMRRDHNPGSFHLGRFQPEPPPVGAGLKGYIGLLTCPPAVPGRFQLRQRGHQGLACPPASPNRWMGHSAVQQTGRISGTFGAVTRGTQIRLERPR